MSWPVRGSEALSNVVGNPVMQLRHIPFNEPPFLGEELSCVQDALARKKISGDGYYSQACHRLLEKKCGAHRAFLTTSCSSALEMTALLADLAPGDEVIVPSFSFVTSASAYAMRGARLVFVDVREDTLNLDERLIEAAITPRTRAIALVHYGGVSCEMDKILAIARERGLLVIEDAAQALGSRYHGKMCGTLGTLGCYSFHETKNVSCGEGGALLVNDPSLVGKAEIVREKGTNRSNFFRGQVDKYTWVDLGSSYLPSDLLAAYLYPQLLRLEEINARRMTFWNRYYEFFAGYEERGMLRRPVVPAGCKHNAHLFYILLPTLEQRRRFIEHMRSRAITTVFHFVPLHSSPGGKRFGHAPTPLPITDSASDRLVRMPLYYNFEEEDFLRVLNGAREFFEKFYES